MTREFNSQVSALRAFYREQILIDVRKIKPEMESLFELIEANPRTNFKDQFRSLITELKTLTDLEATPIVHILDFCMRRLRWPEIETALKEVYALIPDLSIKLDVEVLIKQTYDPKWSGGAVNLSRYRRESLGALSQPTLSHTPLALSLQCGTSSNTKKRKSEKR